MVRTRRLDDIDLEYVKEARVAYSNIYDFPNKTLIVEFDRPMTIVSTLEGQREGITTVGNHYSSPPHLGHRPPFRAKRNLPAHLRGDRQIRRQQQLFVHRRGHGQSSGEENRRTRILRSMPWPPAGWKPMPQRMSKDTGFYYEPGTINIIVMANMKLTPRAMTPHDYRCHGG